MPGASPRPHRSPRDPGAWAIALGYLLLFLGLDWVGDIRPVQGLNITPWNPQPALAIVLLMREPRLLWLVWLGLVLTELGGRGLTAGGWVLLLSTAALAATYALMARVLAARLDGGGTLTGRHDLPWLGAVTVVGALASGLAYVGTLTLAGQGPTGPFLGALARYWVGDVVGLIVLLPALLLLMARQRRAALLATLRRPEWWAAAALTTVLLAVVFEAGPRDAFKFFYLLFIPVIWVSLRLGLVGVVPGLLLLQLGLLAAVQGAPFQDLTVFELQMLVAVLTMTGLVLGMAVDERERTAARLRGSLRLAAAGQMAAALAHELGQPLTALDTYAQASRLLLDDPGRGDAERLARLAEVSARMAAEARRASEVVRRLRDFFRSGSVRLQRCTIEPLLAEARQAAEARRATVGARLVLALPPEGLPPLQADPVQVAVVLRNLVDNALDAVAPLEARGEVTLRAGVHDGRVLVEVLDNGPGLPEARLGTLFEPDTSDKPGGMGIGLSICRALVEAHGGALWARPGPGGLFCFSLPIDPSQPESLDLAQQHRIHRR
jgi:two-component system sensor kinase FixL